MHFRIIFSIVVLVVLTISCKKETFPDNEDLKGSWAEISYLEDTEELYFDGEETLYYTRRPSRYIEMDTLIYRLDKKNEKLYLSPITSPGSSESVHKIQLDAVNNELTIWGLHGSSSEQKFKKE